MNMTPAELKEAEANGTANLKEVKSETPSEGSSEDLQPYQKRPRRRECIYISIAVLLGLALVAVLVYFSVTNALKEDPVAAEKGAQTGNLETTTEYISTSTTAGMPVVGPMANLRRAQATRTFDNVGGAPMLLSQSNDGDSNGPLTTTTQEHNSQNHTGGGVAPMLVSRKSSDSQNAGTPLSRTMMKGTPMVLSANNDDGQGTGAEDDGDSNGPLTTTTQGGGVAPMLMSRKSSDSQNAGSLLSQSNSDDGGVQQTNTDQGSDSQNAGTPISRTMMKGTPMVLSGSDSQNAGAEDPQSTNNDDGQGTGAAADNTDE